MEGGKGFQPVGLGSLDQAVDSGAGFGTPRGIGKEPVLASHRERSDGILSQDITDVQFPILTIAGQQIPLVERVLYGLVSQAVPGHTGAVFLQPGLNRLLKNTQI